MITRGTMKSDARQKTIMLTDRTRVICQQVSSHIEALEQQMMEGIDPEELNVFFKVLHLIEHNLSCDGQAESAPIDTERKNYGCLNFYGRTQRATAGPRSSGLCAWAWSV